MNEASDHGGSIPSVESIQVTTDGEGTVRQRLSIDAHLVRLATFPEQNPNPLIETDEQGTVTYLNPVAETRFPDLRWRGRDHPLLAGLPMIVNLLRSAEGEHVEREVDLGEEVFEERICYLRLTDETVVRIYAHDVTERRRAQQAVSELARRVVAAQEEERHRVSRELHDEAGQALAALKLSLRLLESEIHDREALRLGLADAIALVDQTREQIRLIAHALRPPSLDAIGLNPTLEAFCREFARRTELDIIYGGHVAVEPVDAVQISLYRFLQEALANVAVHARARKVEVTLRGGDKMIALWVRDDGIGMDPALITRSQRGQGIAGMRERIELLSGAMWVLSAPGKGANLLARLPLGIE